MVIANLSLLVAFTAITAGAILIQHPLMLSENLKPLKAYRCPLSDEKAAQALKAWVENQEAINQLDHFAVDIWSNEQYQVGRDFDFATSADGEFQPPQGCRILIDSTELSALISMEKLAFREMVAPDDADWFKNYHSFDDMTASIKSWISGCPLASMSSIGQSHEGRDINVVRFSSETGSAAKNVIWISGGIHAREFISSHVASYIIRSIADMCNSGNELVTEFLQHYEFAIAFHINPDGYEFARTQRRMWRKNRRANRDRSFGVDLNRNFDVFWGNGGSSRSPWSDTYMGPSAASEPEVAAIQKFLTGLIQEGRNVTVGVDLHSYGQLIMRPYGYTMDDHPDEEYNKQLGDSIRDAIASHQDGSRYKSQKSAGLYPVTGGFDDYMTEKINAIGFTWELRDTGRYGFILPAQYIEPTCEEVWLGVKAMMRFLLDNPKN
ncbi:hypothetical protein MIR68_001809 [Amoeboaphelidium protococcarum]|nr:hypothetical protein MIR68_001809 [Amoeboaphelidium protococcarum]